MNFSEQLFEKIKEFSSPKEINWIESKANGNLQALQTAFVATPRFISKSPIQSKELINGVSIGDWTLDRLVRVFFLSKFDSSNKESYTKAIDTLFETAEINEAVALISALPFFAFPDYWMLRSTDAVRSNIGLVLEAIAYQNPYPKKHFSELAWNQLVLKCIFNDKAIHRIEGLAERANQELANSISYLAHERWSAGRTITPQAWRLVSRFMNDEILKDIETLFKSGEEKNQIAAALVCKETDFAPAKEILKQHPQLEPQTLSWSMLED
ncbi:MAG: EboA domain-containing protein [Spirosomataceae bacterium]